LQCSTRENPIELEGSVQEFKFTSPHTFIILTVKQEDGDASVEPGGRRAERAGPGRLVEQDPESRRRAEADDRAVAQRCARRRLEREQDQIQGWAADHGQSLKFRRPSPLSIRPSSSLEDKMICPRSIAAVALATICLTAAAWAHDETKYPDWSGQWLRAGGIQWDPTKPSGRGQQAPLTPEYQAIFEASLADQAAAGPAATRDIPASRSACRG
jgi:hypothetical protein